MGTGFSGCRNISAASRRAGSTRRPTSGSSGRPGPRQSSMATMGSAAWSSPVPSRPRSSLPATTASAGLACRGNHAGAAAVYAAMPLVHDMIGLYFAVGNANHLPPWGGVDMLLSTNPIAIAVPALEEPPLVLDMATTVAAYGKVKVAAQQGKTMPEGWMIDREGNPLVDPNRADDGFLLPIGGYKGAALALMFGLLAGTLNGAANGADVVDFNKDDTTPTNTGQAICAIDIKAFAEPMAFKRQVDAVIRQLHGSALLPGFEHIRLPGEDRHRRIAERQAQGIPIPPALHRALDQLAAELAISPLFG